MKLKELLEYTASEFLDDRTDLLQGEPDELWSGKTLVRYFNEAQRRLCRKAWVIIDTAQPDAGVLTLQEGKELYALHSSVLFVYSAQLEDTGCYLVPTSDLRITGQRPADTGYFDINTTAVRDPGRPQAFSRDGGFRQIRIWRAPSATETGLRVLLKVSRYPVKMLTLDKTEECPEVPEDFHMSVLAKYAAGMCLSHPNVDSTQKTFASRLLKEVDEEIWGARLARETAERHAGTPHFSSVTAHAAD